MGLESKDYPNFFCLSAGACATAFILYPVLLRRRPAFAPAPNASRGAGRPPHHGKPTQQEQRGSER